MCGATRDVRFGPIADIVLFDPYRANARSCFTNCYPHRPFPAERTLAHSRVLRENGGAK
jgi:hypothetical protein